MEPATATDRPPRKGPICRHVSAANAELSYACAPSARGAFSAHSTHSVTPTAVARRANLPRDFIMISSSITVRPTLEIRIRVRLFRRNWSTECIAERSAAHRRVERRTDWIRQHARQRHGGIATQIAELLAFHPEVARTLIQQLLENGNVVGGTAVRALSASSPPVGDERERRRRVAAATQCRLGRDVLCLESRREPDRIRVARELLLDDRRKSVQRGYRLS